MEGFLECLGRFLGDDGARERWGERAMGRGSEGAKGRLGEGATERLGDWATERLSEGALLTDKISADLSNQ